MPGRRQLPPPGRQAAGAALRGSAQGIEIAGVRLADQGLGAAEIGQPVLQSPAGRHRAQPQHLLRPPLGFGGGQQQVIAGHHRQIRYAPQAAEGIGQQRPTRAALQLPQHRHMGGPGLGSAAPRPSHDQAGSIRIEAHLRPSALVQRLQLLAAQGACTGAG